MSTILKWGVILVVGYLVLRWGLRAFASMGGPVSSDDSGLLNAPYAAPIFYPATPVYGWAPFRGRPGRGGGRGRRRFGR